MSTAKYSSTPIKSNLIAISSGWIVTAGLEALAYTVLAWAIVHHQTPGIVLLCAAVSVAVTILIQRSSFYSGVRLAGSLYDVLGQALAQAKLSWFNEGHRALVASVAGRNIPGLMSFPAHQVQAFVYAPLIPIFLLSGMLWIANSKVVLCVALLIIGSFLIQFISQTALIRFDSSRQGVESASARGSLELLEHLDLLRTAAGPVNAIQRIESNWKNEEEALDRTNKATALAMFFSTLASILPLAGLLVFWLIEGLDSLYQGLALIILTLRAAAPLDALAHAGLGINNFRTAFENYRKAIRIPTLPEPPATSPASPDNEIEIDNVSYVTAQLQKISAKIPEGARVHVTGRSGSGKSTLLELLMRFDDPDEGSIRIGGCPLNQMRHENLVNRIAYVSQHPIMFTGTLAENIRLGRPGASDDEVTRVARTVSLDAVIDRSELGINQPVGHHGSALSGGECQRVAIARALIKNAPILILDEATSALDEDTEIKIAKVVRNLPSTVFIATHRNPDIWKPTHTIELTGVTRKQERSKMVQHKWN